MPYRGGHARREQLARDKGFASYRAYRRAGAERREAATRALAQRRPAYARTGAARQAEAPAKRRGRVQIFRAPERVGVRTRREDVLRSQLRRNGHRQVKAFLVLSDGSTYPIFQHGGWRADRLLRLAGAEHGGSVIAALLAQLAYVYGVSATPDDVADVREVDLFFEPRRAA